MKAVILDGNSSPTKEALHEHLARELNFPAWYGGNLDALFDCLTSVTEEVTINAAEASLTEALGPYAQRVIKVLGKAAENNPHIQFKTQ